MTNNENEKLEKYGLKQKNLSSNNFTGPTGRYQNNANVSIM